MWTANATPALMPESGYHMYRQHSREAPQCSRIVPVSLVIPIYSGIKQAARSLSTHVFFIYLFLVPKSDKRFPPIPAPKS